MVELVFISGGEFLMEKKCANCRKYKTEDCPPWPTKGPNHWCTQYEMDVIEARNEKSRVNVTKLDKYEIKFLGPFKNGMKWSEHKTMHPKQGIFHIVGGSKTSVHLVPEHGNVYEKFSVPKNKMKVIRRVKE